MESFSKWDTDITSERLVVAVAEEFRGTRKALHFRAGNWEYVHSKSITCCRHRNARTTTNSTSATGEHQYCCRYLSQCARALNRVGIRGVGGGVSFAK